MRLLKHILAVVALLAAVLPCGHASTHHEHHHHADEPCSRVEMPCECHSCEHQACAGHLEIVADRTPVPPLLEYSSVPVLLFVLPQTEPLIKQLPPLVFGILASLKTVQLLI